jgi:hypothetical protein
MRLDNIDIVNSINEGVFRNLNFHSTQLLLDTYDLIVVDAIAKEINQDK